MGLQAFSNLHGGAPRGKNRQLYLLTQEDDPYCATHFKVTIVLSDTKESKLQGGDRFIKLRHIVFRILNSLCMYRGNFFMVLNGDSYSSVKLRLNAEETYFEPGNLSK